MVLVWVALYTCYQQQQQQQQVNVDNDNKQTTDEQTTDTPLYQVWKEHRGPQLYQQTIGRCTFPTTSSFANTKDDHLTVPFTTTTTIGRNMSSRRHSSLESTKTAHHGLELFRDDVRQEWINAVFGSDFLKPTTDNTTQRVPKQGMGLAGVAPYVTYQVQIPTLTTTMTSGPTTDNTINGSNQNQTMDGSSSTEKVGLTVSRLPLGLYVHKVEVGSEAFYANVQEGSVLVSINGMYFLAEQSKHALERIWQYEGYFRDTTTTRTTTTTTSSSTTTTASTDDTTTSSASNQSSNKDHNDLRMKEPVILEFIYKGQRSKVLFLSNPPWGISWAPCGNFPLVKRVYAHAAKSGVKIGSLLASINGQQSFRTMDHADMAMALRDAFTNHQRQDENIQLTLCFTPAAARTGHYERTNNPDQVVTEAPSPKWSSKSVDGVEVKFHPLEYVVGSICQSGVASLGLGGSASTAAPKTNFSEALASKVAAGLLEAPTGGSNIRRLLLQEDLYSNDESTRRRDGGSSSLSSKVRVYSPCPVLSYGELFQMWDPLESMVYCLRLQAAKFESERFGLIASQEHGSAIQTLKQLTARQYSTGMVGSFLLQFIGIICAPSIAGWGMEQDEKKTEDREDSETLPTTKAISHELTSILLSVSRKDEGFCQRLYFLLRSFISILEAPRPQSANGEGPRNLTALLNCLELLRFAEKELAGRNEENMSRPCTPVQTAIESAPLATQVTNSDALEEAPSPVRISPIRSHDVNDDKKHTKKKLFGRFRKKKGSHKRSSSAPFALTTSAVKEETVTRPLSPKKPLSPRKSYPKPPVSPAPPAVPDVLHQSPSVMYENMSDFLGELDRVCGTIERSLQKSFRQKMADWAMQPWSPSKDSALAEVTETMRRSLRQIKAGAGKILLVNPVDSSELLSSVDYGECYILPSAHFPILLTFDVSEKRTSDQLMGEERMYRTKVELVSLKSPGLSMDKSYVVHAAVAGSISESGQSRAARPESKSHSWARGSVMSFNTRSSWGSPQTLSLRLSAKVKGNADNGFQEETEEIGYGWLDLSQRFSSSSGDDATTFIADIWPVHSDSVTFDEHGYIVGDSSSLPDRIELKVKISTQNVCLGERDGSGLHRKRMLLYKHDDDLRQEAFAIQFIGTCDSILKASGLDMKLLTFQCIPVGAKRGFVEWVPGSVPLSEICPSFAGSLLTTEQRSSSDVSNPSMFTKAGLSKYESLRRLGGQQNESLRRLGGKADPNGPFANNPIQEYLRSVAYDADEPYLIRRDVMDTYVKSCAGYSVIAYILGVGDRHLDNLLLHQSGAFFHCDYSFILGSDPKMYLPVRVTDDMVYGMGGKESDNYARFLSLVGAAFLSLRQPENVRLLLSMVRLMEFSRIPDISENQTTEKAVADLRERFRLDLSDQEAIAYIEDLVASSQSSKMWMAVDAMHSLGKKF